MSRLIIRLLINATAIWVAAELIAGVTLTDNLWGIALVALVFGVVNALLRPIANFLGFPFILLTLGLFALVINAGLLALTAWLTDALQIAGFWPALWGALVVSIVSWFLSNFLGTKKKRKR